MAVTEVHEIADLIAEYEGTRKVLHLLEPIRRTPSLGNTGMELAMMDTGASDIRPVNVKPSPQAHQETKIMKRSVIRVTMELEVRWKPKQYLQFLQELPDLFSLHEFSNLRCRVTWKQKRVSNQQNLHFLLK